MNEHWWCFLLKILKHISMITCTTNKQFWHAQSSRVDTVPFFLICNRKAGQLPKFELLQINMCLKYFDDASYSTSSSYDYTRFNRQWHSNLMVTQQSIKEINLFVYWSVDMLYIFVILDWSNHDQYGPITTKHLRGMYGWNIFHCVQSSSLWTY